MASVCTFYVNRRTYERPLQSRSSRYFIYDCLISKRRSCGTETVIQVTISVPWPKRPGTELVCIPLDHVYNRGTLVCERFQIPVAQDLKNFQNVPCLENSWFVFYLKPKDQRLIWRSTQIWFRLMSLLIS